jgi:hypothetical protein
VYATAEVTPRHTVGLSEGEIAAELEAEYLSSDPNVTRRDAYIQRTLHKAKFYIHS